jgi:MFS family permease
MAPMVRDRRRQPQWRVPVSGPVCRHDRGVRPTPRTPARTLARRARRGQAVPVTVTDKAAAAASVVASRRRFLLPLALAQFICSFAGSNMNVMINDITHDLDTTVTGVQAAITLFLLIMAVLMIPASKLSDRWGRKRCFTAGLVLYGIGALMSAAAPGLGVLILGNSVLEGVGTALLIPPVYILTTLKFHDLTSRAKAFGVISGLGGIGAAAGPLIGGAITTAISWRAAFVFQAAVVAAIVLLSRRVTDPIAPDPERPFDALGAVLSAVGMFFVVAGILQADSNGVLMAVLLAAGAAFLAWFFLHIRARERAGEEPLLSTGLFRNRTSNLGLATQNLQWLLLIGVSFVVAVFLQTVRGYNAIETGVIFTAATVGVLVSSLAAERLAKRRAQKTLIMAGFVVTAAGIALLLALVGASSRVVAFAPGLLLIGLGIGVMLTPSVNVVQSSFPEEKQGEISGLSRSISNLGSSFGTAIAGTILVSDLASGNTTYVIAMVVLAGLALVGLAVAIRLPAHPERQGEPVEAAAPPAFDTAAEHG